MHSNQAQLAPIMSALKLLKPQIVLFNHAMQDFKKRLENVNNQNDFLTLLGEISHREQELNQLFRQATAGIDKDTFEAVQNQADPELKEILDVFNTDHGLANLINATRERLSEKALYEQLTGEEQRIAKDFIQRLKQLRSVAQLLEAQRGVFQQRLNEAEELKTIAEIEEDIVAQHEGVAKIYEAIIFYPKEEGVATALVEYFEMNPQLLMLIQAFNFYDSLKNELNDAKTRLKQS